jgi:hypothetical protein
MRAKVHRNAHNTHHLSRRAARLLELRLSEVMIVACRGWDLVATELVGAR